MNFKVILVAALLVGAGIVAPFVKVKAERPPESWLVNMMPTQVQDFRVVPMDTQNPRISYVMDERSYDMLDPIGIAAQRVKDQSGREIDVVVISGDSMDAFHDQQVCFTAQGWEVREMQQVILKTRTRGDIPISKMRLAKNNREQPALYFFRSPKGFNTYNGSKLDFFFHLLTHGKPGRGFSYRFIGITSDVTEQDLLAYASAFLDTAHDTTNGVL